MHFGRINLLDNNYFTGYNCERFGIFTSDLKNNCCVKTAKPKEQKMNKFMKMMDSRQVSYIMAGLMIVLGLAFAITSWIVGFKPLMNHGEIHVSLPLWLEKITIVIGIILWAGVVYSCWQDYQNRDLSRFWFWTSAVLGMAFAAGMIWSIPVLSLFGFGSAGLFCAAIAIGGGFLIKITRTQQPLKIH